MAVLPIVLVRLCSCCAFLNDSNSCWSRKSSYSDTLVFCLPSGSKLEDLTGEGEWMRSDSREPVLVVRSSSRGADEVSLSVVDLRLKTFSWAWLASLETSPVLSFKPIVRSRLWILS